MISYVFRSDLDFFFRAINYVDFDCTVSNNWTIKQFFSTSQSIFPEEILERAWKFNRLFIWDEIKSSILLSSRL